MSNLYYEVTAAASGATNWLPLNQHRTPFNVSFTVSVSAPGVSAAVTTDYTVQHTLVDVFKATPATGDIFDHSIVSGQSGSIDGNYAFPVHAVRLFVSGLASGGTMMFRVRQAG